MKVWDLLTGTELRSLGGHKQTVTAVVFLSTEVSTPLGLCTSLLRCISCFCVG